MMRGIPRARCGIDARHDKRWRNIRLSRVVLGQRTRCEDTVTDLIARVNHDVRSAKEAGDCGRMCMEKTLFRLRNTITTPVDLYELGELGL